MLSVPIYMQLFNAAYSKELKGKILNETDLPAGDRIVERISRYLKDNEIKLRESGGYNHYMIANWLASNPLTRSSIDDDTLNRFEKIFENINKLLPETDEDEIEEYM